MYTSKRGKQKKRRKTQKQHCFMDEALLLNYPFPNKIFNFPKSIKSMAINMPPEGIEMWSKMSEMERQFFISKIQKDIKGGGFKGGSTTFEIGLTSWYNYIIGLRDLVVEKIIDTYKNTLPIPVLGEIVKILTAYLSLISVPILWLVGLIANAFTALVSTVKTNWHYVFILITSLDLVEWAGAAMDSTGNPFFSPAHAVSNFLNSTVLNFGVIVNFIWSIIVSIWTIVAYWIPSNLWMFIFSNSLFSFSIVIYIFIVIIMWISERVKPSYYILMMNAKQEMNDINKRLIDFSKNNSDIPSDEFIKKEKKIKEDLRTAKELYRELKRNYEEDLENNFPEKFAEYNLKKSKDKMDKAEKERNESLSDLRKATKSNVKAEITRSKRQLDATTLQYQTAKAEYEALVTVPVVPVIPNVSYDSDLGSPTNGGKGGNRNTRKENQKEVDYESIIHRLFSKKSLANFKNISTAELEEIRKEQPFPFEIALALGFMKKTDDGYELVEKRIQKIKEPVIQSMSFLNHRCKGCKPKTHRTTQKGGLLDAPLENHEFNSLREALTGVKMLHTASIYAITREAVEMEDKQKMSGGGDSQDPDPFLNIPQTLNQLKPTDMDWLQEKFPGDFKIAQKLGIVSNGELSHSAREIIQDTAEMSKSMIKKKIPKASQKVLFP